MLELNFAPFLALETERLLLREITEADIHEIFLLRSDKISMKYIDRPIAKSEDDARDLLNRMISALNGNTGITWGIQFKEKPELIGTIGFWRIDKENHRGEIGYMLRPGFFRMGIASEALTAAMNYAFKHLNFHSIEANINTENDASMKLLEKLGFRKEAHFRENYYADGKFLDSIIYCLLASDNRPGKVE